MPPSWIVLTLLLFAAGALFVYLRRRRAANEPAPCGIVLLLRKPVPINAHTLGSWFSEVTGRTIEVLAHELPPQPAAQAPRDSIFSSGPHLIAFVGDVTFLGHILDHPYMPDPAEAATKIGEMRIAHTVAEHNAWFSLDILHPEQATPENYRIVAGVVARFLSATAQSECLALYHPPLNAFAPYSDGTIGLLRSSDPINAIFVNWSQAPVIPVNDDPRMKAAEAEARRRFPEFEDAFRSGSGENFSVKAAITEDGNTEHIWIEVERLEDGDIHGVLGNDPVNLGELKLGSPMSITQGQLEDWVFQRGQEFVGAFTMPVLQAIQEERSRG